MRTVALSITLLLATMSASHAADCTKIMDEYESLGKQLSLERLATLGDNSAPRATNSILNRTNLLLNRQMNLTLMIQGGCPMPDGPEREYDYMSDAIKCMSAQLGNTKEHPECDQKTWTKKK